MEQIAFVQLSDLHIGRRMMGNRFTSAPLLDGKNCHAGEFLEPLRRAVIDAGNLLEVDDPERLPIIVTGDLTADGSDADFALAMCLLHQRWPWRLG